MVGRNKLVCLIFRGVQKVQSGPVMLWELIWLLSRKQAMTELKRSQKKKKQDFCSTSISCQPLFLLTSGLKEIKIMAD